MAHLEFGNIHLQLCLSRPQQGVLCKSGLWISELRPDLTMAEGRKEAISEFPACFLAERVGHQVLWAVAARHPNVSLYLFTRLLHPQHLDGSWSGLTPHRLPLDTLSEYPEP